MMLVVLGHAWFDSPAVTIIYAFHMPLFFFISGALWKSNVVDTGWLAFLSKQFRTLLVPYLCFGLISLVIMLAARTLLKDAGEARTSLVSALFPLVYGAGRQLRDINGTLWFFTALFVTNVYYFLLCRVQNQSLQIGLTALIATAAIAIRQLNDSVLPWNLDVAGVALVFFVIGHCLLGRQQEQAWNRRGLLFGSGALLAVLCAFVALSNSARVDMRSLVLGSPPMFFVGAFAGVLATVLLAMVVPPTRFAEAISKASIVIFPMHVIFLLVFQVLEKRYLGVPDSFAEQWPRGLLFASVSLLACLPIYWFFKRFLPFCIGGR